MMAVGRDEPEGSGATGSARGDRAVVGLGVGMLLTSAISVRWATGHLLDLLPAGADPPIGLSALSEASSPAVATALLVAAASIGAARAGKRRLARALGRGACLASLAWALGPMIASSIGCTPLICSL